MNRLSAYQSGTGPGVITDDGCAVDVYALLPPGPEPQIIHDALAPGARILELGAGAGRITHALLALGHPVVAVDESAEMLAHIRATSAGGPEGGAQTVCNGIEKLDLGPRFDAVVLGSHLINSPDAEQRREFLAACARHLAPGGQVLIEQAPAAFFTALMPGRFQQAEVTTAFRNIRHPQPDLLSMTIDYQYAGRCWSQNMVARRFDMTELTGAGLRLDRHLTDDGAWFAATAIPGGEL